MSEEKRNLSVITGIFIENEKNEILFVRMPKWGDTLGVPGGHVEYGETLEECARRELLEETGLETEEMICLSHGEIINPKQFHKPKHFITFEFKAPVTGRPDMTFNDEISEGVWLTIDDALARDDLNDLTRISLNKMKNGDCGECAQYKTGWQRANADYENLKKEVEKMRSEWVRMSEVQIIEKFLPVYDNFKKAYASKPADEHEQWANWEKGIGYIMKQFSDILTQHNIEEIPTHGRSFDPNRHEAVSEEDGGKSPGEIVREVEGGYMIGDRVLKPAKVVVQPDS